MRATPSSIRDVAIKILSEALAHDPERLACFEGEAKVLASSIHGVQHIPSIGFILYLECAENPVSAGLKLIRARIKLSKGVVHILISGAGIAG